MKDGLKQARRALGKGDADRALVLLWNEVEPSRLAGDRRALATIEGLGAQIAREADESQKREAERLVEAVRRVVEDAAARPATAEVAHDVVAVGEEVEPGEPEEAEPQAAGGFPIGTIVWLLVLVAVVIFNLLGQTRD